MDNFEKLDHRAIINSVKYERNKAKDEWSWRVTIEPTFLPSDNLLPQIEAILAPYIKTDSLKQTISNLTSSNSDLVKAAWMVLVGCSRSKILKSPLKKIPEYSGATPGLMAIAKRINGVPYSKWDMFNPDNRDYLYRSMPEMSADLLYNYYNRYKTDINYFSKEKLLEWKISCPSTGVNFKSSGNDEFDKLRKWYKMLLCQVWIWETKTSDYVIHNLDDLDAAPINLGTVLPAEKPSILEKAANSKIPW